MKQKLFTLLLAVAASVGTMFASDTQVNGIWYDFDSSNSTATVTYRGVSELNYNNEYIGSVVIPASVSYGGRTYSVTSIGNYAFENCPGLTSVRIGNSVTSIGARAFSRCTGLTSVTIGNSVTSIGARAFYNCTGLTSPVYNAHVFAFMPTSYSGAYTIPDGIESIAGGAFSGCTGLTSVTIPNSVTSIGYSAFENCTGFPVVDNIRYADTYLIEAVDKTLSTYTIKDGTKWIGNDAFSHCTGLTSVAIPNSVTSIGDGAFVRCTGLTSVTIGNSVTSIEDYTFLNCTGLTSVTIGNSVTSIGTNAFNGCSVNTINFTGTLEDWPNKVWSPVYISNNYKLKINGVLQENIIIPNSVINIGDNAFNGCNSLASIEIPNSVTSIGDGAFGSCSGLFSVTINSDSIVSKSNLRGIFGSQVKEYIIGDGVTSIGQDAFRDCTGLTSVTIGNGVSSIGNSAFFNCTGLTSVTIPNSVTSIGGSAFSRCTGLTSVAIPNSVTSIGDGAFGSCSGLFSVTINSDSIVSKSNLRNIFGTQVKEYIIGDGVTSIGQDAFRDCTGLTSVSIGNSVTSIGQDAFRGCCGLTSIVWNATNCSDFTDVETPFYRFLYFDIRAQIESFTFGDEVEHIPAYICQNMSSLTSVTIPNSVTSIGLYAFRGCTGLTSVNITDIAAWCNIAFISFNCNPLYCAKHLYVNNVEVTNLVIPEGVTSIETNAFSGCTSLTSVTIPNSVTSIGYYAFYNCTGLTSVTIPNSVTSIGESAFQNCTGLTSVTIPNSVTSIGRSAFYGCTGLTSVTIGNSVTSIEYSAFENCTGLTSVTCLAPTPPTCWGGSSFFSGVNCSNIPLYVPMESVSLYQAVYIWKEFNVIGVMFADEVETAVFSATPTNDYGVILEWQAVESAVLYNIDIIQGNDTIRKLLFDSNGKLLNSPSNAPSRYPNIHHASTAILSGNGWRYEVNDLDPGTNYTYSITVKAENGSVLYSQSIGFTTKEETFIIKFVNWNGEELLVLPDVVKGTTPSYTGETPVRPNTAEYTYTFVGWTPAIVAATSDTTYTATYTATKNSYTITWQNEDGSLIDQTTVEYGVVPTHAEPTKEATEEYTYTFTGWTPAVVAVTGDATYKATFSSVVNVYTISVSAVNGQVIGGGEYQYGATIDLTAIPDEGYVFDQWSDGVKDNPRTITVTGDAEYTALFTSTEGFENIYTSEPVQKVIIDQKVFILRGDKVYNAQGALVK